MPSTWRLEDWRQLVGGPSTRAVGWCLYRYGPRGRPGGGPGGGGFSEPALANDGAAASVKIAGATYAAFLMK